MHSYSYLRMDIYIRQMGSLVLVEQNLIISICTVQSMFALNLGMRDRIYPSAFISTIPFLGRRTIVLILKKSEDGQMGPGLRTGERVGFIAVSPPRRRHTYHMGRLRSVMGVRACASRL